MKELHAFTVQEANALLPTLETVFARIEAWTDRLNQHHQRLQVLELLWGERLDDPGNPDHAEALAERAGIADMVARIQDEVEREILARGIRFPQGALAHGLADFPTRWKGRWVFLCWRRGESEVEAWHELETGFAGRIPLTEEQRLLMGPDG